MDGTGTQGGREAQFVPLTISQAASPVAVARSRAAGRTDGGPPSRPLTKSWVSWFHRAVSGAASTASVSSDATQSGSPRRAYARATSIKCRARLGRAGSSAGASRSAHRKAVPTCRSSTATVTACTGTTRADAEVGECQKSAGRVLATSSARSNQPQASPDSPARACVMAAWNAISAHAAASDGESPRAGPSSRRASSVSVWALSHCPDFRNASTRNQQACATATASPEARAVAKER